MDNPIRVAMQNLPGRWHQGSLNDGEGNFCGMGHVANALGISGFAVADEKVRQIGDLMNEVAVEQYPECDSFADFNDRKGRTEAEVLAVMEKVAIRLDEALV